MKPPEVPGGKNRGEKKRGKNRQYIEENVQCSNTGRRNEFCLIWEIQFKIWNSKEKTTPRNMMLRLWKTKTKRKF